MWQTSKSNTVDCKQANGRPHVHTLSCQQYDISIITALQMVSTSYSLPFADMLRLNRPFWFFFDRISEFLREVPYLLACVPPVRRIEDISLHKPLFMQDSASLDVIQDFLYVD